MCTSGQVKLATRAVMTTEAWSPNKEADIVCLICSGMQLWPTQQSCDILSCHTPTDLIPLGITWPLTGLQKSPSRWPWSLHYCSWNQHGCCCPSAWWWYAQRDGLGQQEWSYRQELSWWPLRPCLSYSLRQPHRWSERDRERGGERRQVKVAIGARWKLNVIITSWLILH